MLQPSTARNINLIIVIVGLGGLIAVERFGHEPALPVSSSHHPQSKQEVIDNFHKVFYESGIWKSTRWLGVPTQQNPNDVWIHQEIIFDVKPDFIVEAGTLKGGSAALW